MNLRQAGRGPLPASGTKDRREHSPRVKYTEALLPYLLRDFEMISEATEVLASVAAYLT